MKHLKTFENDNIIYKEGSYVKCIDVSGFDNDEYLKLNRVYYIYKNPATHDYVFISKNNKILGGYNSKRFIYATPEEIEKYKIEENINKYNL